MQRSIVLPAVRLLAACTPPDLPPATANCYRYEGSLAPPAGALPSTTGTIQVAILQHTGVGPPIPPGKYVSA